MAKAGNTTTTTSTAELTCEYTCMNTFDVSIVVRYIGSLTTFYFSVHLCNLPETKSTNLK